MGLSQVTLEATPVFFAIHLREQLDTTMLSKIPFRNCRTPPVLGVFIVPN